MGYGCKPSQDHGVKRNLGVIISGPGPKPVGRIWHMAWKAKRVCQKGITLSRTMCGFTCQEREKVLDLVQYQLSSVCEGGSKGKIGQWNLELSALAVSMSPLFLARVPR